MTEVYLFIYISWYIYKIKTRHFDRCKKCYTSRLRTITSMWRDFCGYFVIVFVGSDLSIYKYPLFLWCYILCYFFYYFIKLKHVKDMSHQGKVFLVQVLVSSVIDNIDRCSYLWIMKSNYHTMNIPLYRY